jgi:hypothetical protein
LTRYSSVLGIEEAEYKKYLEVDVNGNEQGFEGIIREQLSRVSKAVVTAMRHC